MNDLQITAELTAERATPETDAVWSDKSRNILVHSHNLERQRNEAVAELAAERTARKALSKALETCLQYADSTVAAVTAELTAEQVARKALTKALMICIRYADSSADTEQAYAALALAAKLP